MRKQTILAKQPAQPKRAEDDGKALASTVGEGIVFVGDEELLTQMLANLMENAIKHTPQGATIRFELSDAAERATVVVAGPYEGSLA